MGKSQLSPAGASTAAPTSLQEKKALAFAKKGIFLALLSGMIWSLDGFIVTRANASPPFDNPAFWALVPMVCAGIHDLVSAIVTTAVNWQRGRLREVGRSIVSKPGRAVIMGALFGALLGMGGYMAAIQLAGPAYILPITSLYPAVAAVLAVFILKEHIPPRVWAGLALCVTGAIVIGYKAPESQVGTMFYLGLGCAALAALGWGMEGVCAASGMDFIEPTVALNIYYLVSAAFYLLLIIPGVSLFFLPDAERINVLAQFFTSKGLLFVALAGAIGSAAYLCWYQSISMTGVSRAMALNISYSLWAILLSALVTDIEITFNLILGASVIFSGMFLVIGNPREMVNLRKVS